MAKDVRFGTFTNRHNFKFNEDQVSALYLGDNRVWVNEVTITFVFTDSTGDGAQLNGESTQTVVGVPGTTFSSFSRTVTRVDDSTDSEGPSNKLDSVTCTEIGDVDNVIACEVTGSGSTSRTITVSGTIPNNAATIMLDISAEVTTLEDRGCGRSSGNPLSSVGSSGGNIVFQGSWAGGDNGSLTLGGSVDEFGSLSTTVTGGSSSGSNWFLNWDSGDGSLTSISLTLSIGESSTHRSCSYSESRNF